MSMTAGTITVTAWDLGDPENPVTGTETVVATGAAKVIYDYYMTQEYRQPLDWPTWMVSVNGSITVSSGGSSWVYSSDDTEVLGTPSERLYTHLKNCRDSRYGVLQSSANDALAIAQLIPYIAANAVVVGTTNIAANSSTDGLQDGTLHPPSPKTLPVTGTIT